ncbi:MAG: hypothetical protein CEE38_06535 [Planctomycetes bacterium B3_Pla]|nr:MAG: hypothetical protein CEE38_06535 [Planctomycetes bacterium B3_Pla]
MTKKKKRSKPKLLVVFDTSVLFARVAYNLVRSEIKQLVETNSQHSDLTIKWYLPGIVVDERRYQMRNKAFELLPSIEKLERLLGHNLNITKDILVGRVDEAINKQLEELNISTLDLDTADVEWKVLMNRAVYRLPPFELGENEKGFRDSIIAETFLQLTRKSPATPAACRLAIVTNDKLLAEYLRASTKKAKNVRVLNSTNELENLINTLVSKVTEEFVEELKDKVEKFFFENENQACLFYKENIQDKINSSFAQKLGAVPNEGLLRENGDWRISSPVFVKKKGRRLFYMTPIWVDAKLFKLESQSPKLFDFTSLASDALQSYTTPAFGLFPNPSLSDQLPTPRSSGFSGLSIFPSSPSPRLNIGQSSSVSDPWGTLRDSLEKVEVTNGQSMFEVHWSANITQNKRLTVPQIEKIEFVGTKWDTG